MGCPIAIGRFVRIEHILLRSKNPKNLSHQLRKMNELIRQQAEYLGYEVCNWDIEQILEYRFHQLIKNGEPWIGGIRSAIRAYFK